MDGVDGGLNPLAALIAPLAAIALLGAAALVSANPVLLQLAVVNNNGKRRKKRDIRNMEVLGNFLNDNRLGNHADLVLAGYLQCSGLTSDLDNQCLEQMACRVAQKSLPHEYLDIVDM